MNVDKIEKICHEIINSHSSNKEVVFSKKYKEFAEKYPMLLKKCCERNADVSNLGYLLSMLKNIQQNKMTEHVASTNVGQKLFDSYVKPTVDSIEPTPTPETK